MINELAFLTDERHLTSGVIKSPCQNIQHLKKGYVFASFAYNTRAIFFEKNQLHKTIFKIIMSYFYEQTICKF